MDKNQKPIQQLSKLEEESFRKNYKNQKEAFAHYFSELDINGIDNLLSSQNYYDGISKKDYLNLIKKQFLSLNIEGIHSLKAIRGKCNGCSKECSGFTFLDENKGFFMDFILEVKNSEIVNFKECFDFINEVDVPNKKEQIYIKPISLDTDNDEVPF